MRGQAVSLSASLFDALSIHVLVREMFVSTPPFLDMLRGTDTT